MSDVKEPTDFPNVSSEDTISLTLAAAGSPDDVEFILETVSSVTWWKALELRSSDGSMTNQVQTQDANHGPHSFSVPADDLVGATLTLAKAKEWGKHRGMYELQNLSSFRGRRFQFLWESDNENAGGVAGFFRDLGNGINAVADAVADVVETVVETVAEVVSTVIETIGTTVANVLDAIGNFLGGIPVVGGFLRGAFHWVATIVSAAFDLVATVIKGVLDLVANVGAGVIRLSFGAIGGLLAWDGRLIVEGIGDVASGFAGAVVAIVAKALALGQATLGMQLGERPLTKEETEMLWRVYRGSVALYNIRIVDGRAGLATLTTRSPTIGNRIYMGGSVNIGNYRVVLVHECCHVWQYQHVGTRYLTDAIWAWYMQPGGGYDWEHEIQNGHVRWQDFNVEGQAKFLQDIFTNGQRTRNGRSTAHGEFYHDDPIGSDVLFVDRGIDYTELARESVAYVRSAPWIVARP